MDSTRAGTSADLGQHGSRSWRSWMERSLLRLSGVAGLVLLLGTLACVGKQKETAVVSMRGWQMSLPQLEEQYDRINGAGSFSRATAEERETFARTLADKELLLRQAREEEPKLGEKQARILRTTYEKDLLREFLQWRRQSFRVSPEREAEALPRLKREAVIRLVKIREPGLIPQVKAEQAAGAGFDSLALRYGAPVAPQRNVSFPAEGGAHSREITVRVDETPPSPYLVREALLSDLPEGAMSPPFTTPGGPMFLQIEAYHPSPRAEEQGYLDTARSVLESIDYMGAYTAWFDSLRTAAGISFKPEAYPIIQTRFAAFWDSISSAQKEGGSVDFQKLRAPIWIFTPEEQQTPLYTLWGKEGTVGDFVRSLDDIDLDFWPTVGPVEKIGRQIDGRLYRWMIQEEAEKVGLPKRPEFREEMARLEEKGLLTQYHDSFSEKIAQPTEEDVRNFYEREPERYVTPETVSFSILAYPKEKRARAERTLARLRAGGPLLWLDLAPAEHAADSTIIHVPDTGSLNLEKPSPVAAWAPFLEVARTMKAGEISGLIPAGESVGIIRIIEHREKGPMPLERVSKLVHDTLISVRADSLLEAVMDRARQQADVKVYTDRLGGAPAPADTEEPGGASAPAATDPSSGS